MELPSLRSSLGSMHPSKINFRDSGPEAWRTRNADTHACLRSRCCIWPNPKQLRLRGIYLPLHASLLVSANVPWMKQTQNDKETTANFLEHKGLSADSGSPISLSSTIPSMGREAGTVRKLFGRSIWVWLIDNWSVCKLVRPEPTITSCEQVCVREGSRLLHFIRQILSVPLPGCLLLKAGFNRKIKRACFIWHFIHQRPGGWGGWGGKSSAMMIQSLSVMFSRLPFPSFLLTGFCTTC